VDERQTGALQNQSSLRIDALIARTLHVIPPRLCKGSLVTISNLSHDGIVIEPPVPPPRNPLV
jgi:hypothetical protein